MIPSSNRAIALLLLLLALAACRKKDKLTIPEVNPAIGQNMQEYTEGVSGAREADRLDLFHPWSDFEPTGFYLPPNQTMVVKAEQIQGTRLPQLLLGTYAMYQANPTPASINLVPGDNTISGGPHGGLVWVRYGADNPDSKARLNFSGNMLKNPVYIKNKTPAADWAAQLDAAPNVPDVVLIGDRVYQCYRRDRALATKEQDNNKVLTAADKIMDVEDAISGMNGSSAENMPSKIRRILMVESDDKSVYGNASHYRIAFQGIIADYAFTPQITGFGEPTWGVYHEFGHLHQQESWTWNETREVTVNIYSLAGERAMGAKQSKLARENVWPRVMQFLANTDPAKHYNAAKDPFMQMGIFQQLWLAYGDDFYKKLHKQTRKDPKPNNSQEAKMGYFMLNSSIAAGRDLSAFFRKWGFRINQTYYDQVSALKLPPPEKDPATLSD